METYTLRAIQSMLGMSRSVIGSLIAAGFVFPGRGPRREYRFTFQDVVLLRTAYSLRMANIPARKILRSLRHLKATLPSELPLTGLRIAAVGNEIAVKEGDTQWHAESGQLLIDFEVRPAQGSVAFLNRESDARQAVDTADEAEVAEVAAGDWFARGVRLEAEDAAQAQAAYRQAIAQAPHYVDPYLNLGVMLCDAGRCADAVGLYRDALRHCPAEPLLHYNLAIALEDLGRIDDALACYEACLGLDARNADAHYNTARLHEQLGHATKAIRHYSEYRRLQR
jgi:tetratricopeptide (TPR) repeat protein